MAKQDFGGLGDGKRPGGRDWGIGPTGPDNEVGEGAESRKASDMSGGGKAGQLDKSDDGSGRDRGLGDQDAATTDATNKTEGNSSRARRNDLAR